MLLISLAVVEACTSNQEKTAAEHKTIREGWSTGDRKTFLRACEEGLEGNMKASNICSCVLEKMEKQYVSLQLADEEGRGCRSKGCQGMRGKCRIQ